ncbi:hypothetical protein [Iodobacter fluviatilis]|uniref:Uncharacterized protein n=1 Tax=Iodobacter fluviatilis TaxID=537 RepID=A0A377Q5D9_9NEIS|nr:hypothetical protein [Iodobacter fluviatilis]TCU84566.1 hypothetical protein EV682_10991 [Iodobacter fluviatilis]STQ90032.1 Uncharacterised protein [Iodobacter fluviatilis]
MFFVEKLKSVIFNNFLYKNVAYPGDYHLAFIEARERTINFGLEVDSISFKKQTFLSDMESASKLAQALSEFYFENKIRADDVAGQCWRINIFIKIFLEEYFGVPLVLTIGYIEDYPNNVYYKMTEAEIAELLNSPEGHNGNYAANLHVWLTLPSMEILDVSFMTSFGKVNNKPELLGTVVYGPPEKLSTPNFNYKPMVLGEHFINRVGLNNAFITF